MTKFAKITSTCLPIKTENIDTDQIVPARFLKITTREGFGKYLFYDNLHFHGLIGKSEKILVAGNNFGCGSSREHAVWAITDFGFKVVISSSFGDIFYNNSLKNGLLPVVLKPKELNKLFRIIKDKPNAKITVDLENQSVIILRAIPLSGRVEKSTNNSSRQVYLERSRETRTIIYNFPIDNFRKTCLLKGVDELGYILSFEKEIKDFEKSHQIFISA